MVDARAATHEAPADPTRSATQEASEVAYGLALPTSLARLVGMWWTPSFQSALVRQTGIDVGATDGRVLWELGFEGIRRPSALADRIGLGLPSVSKSVARLVARGWVERTADPTDGRAQILALTEDGRQVAQSLLDVGDRMVERIVDGWSEAEVEEATRVAGRLAAGAEAFVVDLLRSEDPADRAGGGPRGG